MDSIDKDRARDVCDEIGLRGEDGRLSSDFHERLAAALRREQEAETNEKRPTSR